jgi:hypothetical protein
MRKCFAILALCPSFVFAAGTPNDANVPASNTPAVIAPNAVTVTNDTLGPLTQLGRIFRDGTASTCATAKAYPGIFNAETTYNYKTYALYNDGPARCITVNFDPNSGATPCTTNAHVSAYRGSYNPANQAANFIADVGSSVTQPFSFLAGDNEAIVLVVTNTSAADGACTFSFNSPELSSSLTPRFVPSLPNWIALAGLVSALAGIGAFARRRFAR